MSVHQGVFNGLCKGSKGFHIKGSFYYFWTMAPTMSRVWRSLGVGVCVCVCAGVKCWCSVEILKMSFLGGSAPSVPNFGTASASRRRPLTRMFLFLSILEKNFPNTILTPNFFFHKQNENFRKGFFLKKWLSENAIVFPQTQCTSCVTPEGVTFALVISRYLR